MSPSGPIHRPKPADGLDMVAGPLARPRLLFRQRLDPLPFQNHAQPGFPYQTLLIEPPIFLPRLEGDLKARGVTFVDKRFATKADIFATVPQKIIITAPGWARRSCGTTPSWSGSEATSRCLPHGQPNLQYLYSRNGYMFPRSDHVVIGGTTDWDKEDEDLNPAECKKLATAIAAKCGQAVAPVPMMPMNHIDDPRNRRLVDPRLFVSD